MIRPDLIEFMRSPLITAMEVGTRAKNGHIRSSWVQKRMWYVSEQRKDFCSTCQTDVCSEESVTDQFCPVGNGT